MCVCVLGSGQAPGVCLGAAVGWVYMLGARRGGGVWHRAMSLYQESAIDEVVATIHPAMIINLLVPRGHGPSLRVPPHLMTPARPGSLHHLASRLPSAPPPPSSPPSPPFLRGCAGRSLGQFVDLMKKCDNKVAIPDVVVTAVGTKVGLPARPPRPPRPFRPCLPHTGAACLPALPPNPSAPCIAHAPSPPPAALCPAHRH